MVTLPLRDVLQENQIIHPTNVREVRIAGGNVTLEIAGFPWWLNDDEAQKIEEDTAKIELLSISRSALTESCLTKDPCNEHLEEFDVTDLASAPWNKGNSAQVYCSEPLQEPEALLSALDAFLEESGCPLPCTEFLNSGTIHCILSFAKTSMFQAVSGPNAVCEVVTAELDRQGVRYSVTSSNHPYLTGTLVRWWDGFVVCEEAIISWNEKLA